MKLRLFILIHGGGVHILLSFTKVMSSWVTVIRWPTIEFLKPKTLMKKIILKGVHGLICVHLGVLEVKSGVNQWNGRHRAWKPAGKCFSDLCLLWIDRYKCGITCLLMVVRTGSKESFLLGHNRPRPISWKSLFFQVWNKPKTSR